MNHANINASCHTQTHMNQAPIHQCTNKSVLCSIHTSYVTYQSMSHVTHKLTWTKPQSIHELERELQYTHESCHVSINESQHTQTHTNQRPIHPWARARTVLHTHVVSHMNGSCQTKMSHDTHKLTWTKHQSIPQQERAMLQQASLGVSVKFSEILKSHISTADVYYRFRQPTDFSELFRIITYDWFSGFKVQVEILKSQLSSYFIQ